MSSSYAILIILCLIALYSLFLNLKVIGNNPFILLRLVCMILFVYSTTRYVTLIVYGDAPSYSQLVALRYFYFATSMGLTGTTLSAVWYATPLYREKIKYPYMLLGFLPWTLFYLYVILRQPTRIVKGECIGYQLILTGQFPLYLSIVQGCFVIMILILCLIGIWKYKNVQMRVQLGIIMLAQLALTIDGLSYYRDSLCIIPPFTLSEAFGFFAVYYILSNPIKEIKGISNA